MSDTKHTPGPWSFRTAPNGDCGIMADGTGVFAEAFADIRRAGENNRAEAYANAQLITAAPELLEALNDLSRKFERELSIMGKYIKKPIYQQFEASLRKARTAIAKATGG